MSDPIAIVNTPGGPATAANPPVEATLVIPDPDNPGGWIPDPGGGGGSGTVQSVAGVAPDEEGDVPLTHSDLGPIQVGDLGFDPETEEEMEAEVATLNEAIATKAPQSTTYTKTQVDAIAAVAGKFKGVYSTSGTYGAGDVVAYGMALWQAKDTITPGVQYVGGSTSSTGTTVPVPSGVKVGDMAIVALASNGPAGADPLMPSGWAVSGRVASGRNVLNLLSRTITQADITAGTWAITTGGGYVAVAEVYRNAAPPIIVSSNGGNVSTPSGGTLASPGHSVAVGSLGMRVGAFVAYNFSETLGSPSVAAPATNVLSGLGVSGYQCAAIIASWAPGATTIPAGTANITTPSTSGTLVKATRAEGEIPLAPFTPGQWDRIAVPAPNRVAVADANYAADGTEDVIAYSSLTAARAVTLPSAATFGAGRILTVKNETSNASVLTINRSGTDTIDGATSVAFGVAYGALQFYSTGVGWALVRDPVDAAAGTPSLRTLGTGANQAAAGNDSRLSDSRTPLGQSVSTAKLADDLIPAGLSTGSAATNAIAARRIGTQAYDAAPGTLVATVDARLSAAQRTAINALDAGTATVADVVNALKA